jgi:hypothetical protein
LSKVAELRIGGILLVLTQEVLLQHSDNVMTVVTTG